MSPECSGEKPGHQQLRRAGGPQESNVADLLAIDGLEVHVAARLKADPITAGIPIVVVTGRELDDADKERLNEHVLAVLTKGEEGLIGLREWLARVSAARAA